jgi:hypothetical protein
LNVFEAINGTPRLDQSFSGLQGYDFARRCGTWDLIQNQMDATK